MKFDTYPPHLGDWKDNIIQLLSEFGLPISKVNKCLLQTNSVIAGGFALCALSSFCKPKEYDGDLDIFIHYKPNHLGTTELLFDLLFTSSKYQIDYSNSKFKKPEECPVCYRTEEESFSEFKIVQPCQHWYCEDCMDNFDINICPLCRTNITGLPIDNVFHSKEDHKSASGYDEIITIKHFRAYINPITNKKIQCIYVPNVRKSISTFDISNCQVLYGGNEILAYSSKDIFNKIGYCNHPTELTEKQKKRVEKYTKRGFSIYSKYAVHYMRELYKYLPIEKDVITHILYPLLKQKKEKPFVL